MSEMGQNRKSSMRAYVFRSNPESRHPAGGLRCPSCAITGSRCLFDHLVGTGQQRSWNLDAKLLRSLEVDE